MWNRSGSSGDGRRGAGSARLESKRGGRRRRGKGDRLGSEMEQGRKDKVRLGVVNEVRRAADAWWSSPDWAGHGMGACTGGAEEHCGVTIEISLILTV